MIDLKKDADDDTAPAGKARDEATAPLPPEVKSPKASVDVTPPPSAPVSVPEMPSRLPEISRRRGRRSEQPGDDDGKKLVIAREIVLNGKINSCDVLVVEGQVEATMKDCREIKITQTGTFKGQVQFDRADISGVFEGDLTAREHLVVRATGRVTGKVRFGELEIERGGQIIGDVQVFGEGAAAGQDAKGAVDKDKKAK